MEKNNTQPGILLEGMINEPYVLTKNNEDIRCLSNVCTHRGNIVCEDACKTKSLVCGYHGRQFHLDGKMKFINTTITKLCLDNDVLKKHDYHRTDTNYSKGPLPSKRKREFTKKQKRQIREKYNSCCGICKIRLDDCNITPEYDHIIPFSEGGETNIENGMSLCVNCHE